MVVPRQGLCLRDSHQEGCPTAPGSVGVSSRGLESWHCSTGHVALAWTSQVACSKGCREERQRVVGGLQELCCYCHFLFRCQMPPADSGGVAGAGRDAMSALASHPRVGRSPRTPMPSEYPKDY